MAAASDDQVRRVDNLWEIRNLVRSWRGSSSPHLEVHVMPLRDCPTAAFLLRRLARHEGWITTNLDVVEHAASLDKFLQTIAAVSLPRLLLAESDSDSDSDTDSDPDAGGHPEEFVGDHISRATEMALQVGGSVVADLAGLMHLWEKLTVDDTHRHLLVAGIKDALDGIRATTIRFMEPPEPQVDSHSLEFDLSASPSPPRLGSPPPSPTPSPPPAPPLSPQLDARFRSLPAALPARRPEMWAPEHKVVDGLHGIQALLRSSCRAPSLLVRLLATKDCPHAFSLLLRLTRHAGWNVPELYVIEHAAKLDAVLNILCTVTIPRLLLVPVNTRYEAHLEPLQKKLFDAVVETAEVGGALVGEMRWLEEAASRLQRSFLALDDISLVARQLENEIRRIRERLIDFSDPPEPESFVKDFLTSPSPPPLGSPPKTPSP